MAQKIRAIVDRREVILSPVAFRIAEKHFGAVRATSNDLPRPEKPKELIKPVELIEEQVTKPEVKAEVKAEPDEVKAATKPKTRGKK